VHNPFFGLTSAATIIRGAAGSSSPRNDVFTSITPIMAPAVPEPVNRIMMLTGMPLPLVVMGLLRRRCAAA
jgi:hypothetical protein